MIGQTIGRGRRYRIVTDLGDGGMASVYEALDEGSGRRVALKALHAHFAETDTVSARFRREAETCAALRHPNIVELVDFQANPGEPPFLVMELVPGPSLGQLVAEAGPLPAARAAAIAAQVLSALEAAHAAGVVHRDVKPGNVVVATAGGVEIAKLVDFGVAKIMHEAAEHRLTATGNIVGTPYFMAPEQVRRRTVDARTDVYGLGATLYFALSAQRPFADVPRAGVADAVCQVAPERLADLRPDLDPGLAAVVTRAMAKRPEDRFTSAAEMSSALSRWVPLDPALGATTPATPPRRSIGDDIGPELPQPGDVVADKLKIERVVGKGGMGIVYAARHEVLDKEVALKVLVSVPDREATARFVNEAKLIARLKSEHVCHVYDAGTLPSGRPFIAMELLSGVDLATVLAQRGRLPVAEAVDYVLQGLDALAQAHALKIVHRDLKPSNFFLTRRGDEHVVKVLDFGISKSSEALGPQASVTVTGTVMGSPAYMAPEQIRNASTVDARSDVWSLGVVLYELVTGAPPFPGVTVGDVFHAIFTRPPDPMLARRADLPLALVACVMRCLEKDPAARWPDVHALAAALAPLATADPRTSARLSRIRLALGNAATSAPATSYAAPPSRRLRGAFAAAAILALAGGGAAIVWRARARAAPVTAAAAAPEPAAEMTPEIVPTVPDIAMPPSTTLAPPPSAAPSAKPANRPRAPATAPTLLDRRH